MPAQSASDGADTLERAKGLLAGPFALLRQATAEGAAEAPA